MFQSPWFVGLASVIPGLGYLLLKRWKPVILIWLILIFSFALLLISSPESTLELIAWQVFFIVWVSQGFLAFQTAKQEKTISEKKVARAKEIKGSDVIIPLDVPRRKRGFYRFQQMLIAQLDLGEHLKASVFAIDSAQARLGSTQYMLGLTDKDFIALSFDLFGKPVSFKRRPISEIEKIDYRKRLIQDKFFIYFQNEKKPFKLFVSFAFRQEANDFIATLASLKHTNEEASF